MPSRRLYETFSGVFLPTLLTILGVIMYLREGWVVGNADLLENYTVLIDRSAWGPVVLTGLLGSSDNDAELAAAITIFTLRLPADSSDLREQARRTATPCLFALDSGGENALA